MKGIRLLAALLLLLTALSAAAEGTDLYYDAEDGVWTAFVPETAGTEAAEDTDASPAPEVTDKTGFVSGYIRIPRGRALYRDVNRTEQLGYPLEESVFYAVRRRTYEKGSVYELRFDTADTVGTDHYVTAYYYSRDPDAVGDEGSQEMFAEAAGARVVDGVPLTVVRLRYGEVPGESVEERYNVVLSSGTGVVMHDGTNLREGPGSTYSYIVQLARGEQVKLLGMTVNGVGATWMLVKDGEGNEGFVRADLLGSPPEATPTPVPEPVPTPAPSPSPAPEPTAVPTAAPDPVRSVSVEVHGKASPAIGDTVVLEAVLAGYGDLVTSLQWQMSPDGKTWQDIGGATAETLSVLLTEENSGCYWRVLVTDSEPEIAQ
ncbi:MAG: SH3 domain-containing protein [Clostridia bacterium]|nr:SH3 domain-containing protein [Clostridia bacterium]